MGRESSGQVVGHAGLLQVQRLHNRQQPLNEATSRVTGTAERAFAPQNRRPQGVLGGWTRQ